MPAAELNPERIAPATIRPVPELLAPAGNWECARAAVENGADAIYFGLGRFNARMRADNFTEAELPALMEFLHRRGVRGYVTFNTLIFSDELPAAEKYLRASVGCGRSARAISGSSSSTKRRLSWPGSLSVTVRCCAARSMGRSFGASCGAQSTRRHARAVGPGGSAQGVSPRRRSPRGQLTRAHDE